MSIDVHKLLSCSKRAAGSSNTFRDLKVLALPSLPPFSFMYCTPHPSSPSSTSYTYNHTKKEMTWTSLSAKFYAKALDSQSGICMYILCTITPFVTCSSTPDISYRTESVICIGKTYPNPSPPIPFSALPTFQSSNIPPYLTQFSLMHVSQASFIFGGWHLGGRKRKVVPYP